MESHSLSILFLFLGTFQDYSRLRYIVIFTLRADKGEIFIDAMKPESATVSATVSTPPQDVFLSVVCCVTTHYKLQRTDHGFNVINHNERRQSFA